MVRPHLTSSLQPAVSSNYVNLENNCVAALPDGLLAALDKISSITLSRNQFTAYPAGGPAQFLNITALNMEHNLCDRSVCGLAGPRTSDTGCCFQDSLRDIFPR